MPVGFTQASILCPHPHSVSVPDTLDTRMCHQLGGRLHLSPVMALVSAKAEVQVGDGWDNMK